ncbi:maleylpyruvate isomerase family mycothiol-dependent enzyme [Sesbania bispinosa]|nr:maleylpyruvate isomerase family mycothiol-dependent enzyme [Sesbania bispinosa]
MRYLSLALWGEGLRAASTRWCRELQTAVGRATVEERWCATVRTRGGRCLAQLAAARSVTALTMAPQSSSATEGRWRNSYGGSTQRWWRDSGRGHRGDGRG